MSISLWDELIVPSQLWLRAALGTPVSTSMFKKLSVDWDFSSCSPTARNKEKVQVALKKKNLSPSVPKLFKKDLQEPKQPITLHFKDQVSVKSQ